MIKCFPPSTAVIAGSLVLGAVSATAATGPSVPTFTNGGFELTTGDSPSQTTPGWTKFSGEDADTWINDPERAFEGNWFLSQNSDGQFSDQFIRTETPHYIDVTPGTDYTFSVMLSTPTDNSIKGTGNIVFIRANYFDINQQILEPAVAGDQRPGEVRLFPYDGTNDPFPDELINDAWIEATGSSIAPAEAAFVRPSFLLIKPFREAGELLVDNVRFFETGSDLMGDYNSDGFVSQGDLDLVLLNWGDQVDVTGVPRGWTSSAPTGQISQANLDQVLLNWGSGTAPSFAAIPEPSALALMGLASLTAFRRQRKK